MVKAFRASCVALLAVAQLAQGCIHDALEHQLTAGHQHYSDVHPFLEAERRRRLGANSLSDDMVQDEQTYRVMGQEAAASSFEPLRITPYYDDASLVNLPTDTRAVLVAVLDDAMARIHMALQVVPVQGSLFAQRWCKSYWKTTPSVCHALQESEMCLEMAMPDAHFASTKYCTSCTSEGCATGDCTESPAGAGVPGTDFLLYVRAEQTANCNGETLAYASTCQQDQFDRPTFGMANFCPAKLSTAPEDYERQVATALHELSHALGFSARFFPLMRFPDGTPRTPRDENGNPPTYTSGTCPNGNTIEYFVEPAETVVQHFEERDHVVAKMVTPRVRAFVQQHFSCSSLAGAELESQDSGCLGSHWEERLFEPEFMSPMDSFRNVFSALTLAFFEDSGWYRANYSTAQRLHFGEQRGCAFAREKCVDPATQTPLDATHYCTADEVESCSVDATARSVCAITNGTLAIPGEYQYFPLDPTKAGVAAFADYCPLNMGFASGDCRVETNLMKIGDSDINMLGETYCPTCRCAATTLRSDDSSRWTPSARRQSGCYAMQCLATAGVDNATETIVELSIPRSATGDVVVVNCSVKSQQLSVPGFSGVLTCPDPFVICDGAPSSDLVSGSESDTGVEESYSDSGSGSESESGSSSSSTTGSSGSSDIRTGAIASSGNGLQLGAWPKVALVLGGLGLA